MWRSRILQQQCWKNATQWVTVFKVENLSSCFMIGDSHLQKLREDGVSKYPLLLPPPIAPPIPTLEVLNVERSAS